MSKSNSKNSKKKNSKSNKSQRSQIRVAAPTALSTKSVQAPKSTYQAYRKTNPTINSMKDGSTIVRYTELVADILTDSSGNYQFRKYFTNPGLSNAFPWLKQIALAYDEYQWRKLKYYYSTSTENDAKGKVYIAADYNPLALSPNSVQTITQMAKCANCAPWGRANIVLDPRRIHAANQWLYTRTNDVQDNRLAHDGATITVATVTADPRPGQLYVEYEVAFRCPSHGDGLTGQTPKLGLGRYCYPVTETITVTAGDQQPIDFPSDQNGIPCDYVAATGQITSHESATYTATFTCTAFNAGLALGDRIQAYFSIQKLKAGATVWEDMDKNSYFDTAAIGGQSSSNAIALNVVVNLDYGESLRVYVNNNASSADIASHPGLDLLSEQQIH